MRPARFCELRQFRTNWPNRQGSGIPGNSAQTGQAPAIGPFRAKPARPSPFPLRSRAITFSARRSNCRALHLFLSGAVLSPLLPEGSLLPQVPLRSRPITFSARRSNCRALHLFLSESRPSTLSPFLTSLPLRSPPPLRLSPTRPHTPFPAHFRTPAALLFTPPESSQFSLPPHPRNRPLFLPGDE